MPRLFLKSAITAFALGALLAPVPVFAQQWNSADGTTRTTTDSAFQLYWDSATDTLKFRCATSGAAASAITWTDGPSLDTSCVMTGGGGGGGGWQDDGTDVRLVTLTDQVGIGTATPDEQLHLYAASGFNALEIENDGTTSSDGPGLTINRGGTGAWGAIDFKTADAGVISAGLYAGDTSDGFSIWNSGPTIRLYVESNATGYTGINTGSPAARLHAVDDDTTGNSVLEILRLEHRDSNSAGADGIGAALTFYAETETGATNNEFARIAGVADDAANGSRDGSLRFYTVGANASSGAAATEQMRIDSAGNVGVGLASPGVKLSVGNGATSAGALGIYEDTDNGTNYASFTVPALAANTVYTLPPDDGDAGEQLQTDGSGNLTWESAGGGGGGGAIDDLSDAETDYTVDHNLWMGSNAGAAIQSGGQYNLGVGENAGDSITTGDYNLAIGAGALEDLTTGEGNVAIGRWALGSNNSQYNVVIGYNAAPQFTGFDTTAIGYQALGGNTTSGQGNTVIGRGAAYGANSFSGNYNNVVGALSMGAASSADSNNIFGQDSASALTTGDNNIVIGADASDTLTTGSSNIIIGTAQDVPANNTSSHLNVGGTVYGDLANDRIRIGGSGAVTVGPLYAVPPSAEVIGAGATITANACGTIKQISASANRTTNTTNTFTASTPAGCCMDVINVDTADTITLDANTAFKTAGGTDQGLGPYDSVRVCSDGTTWYQMGAVSGNQ